MLVCSFWIRDAEGGRVCMRLRERRPLYWGRLRRRREEAPPPLLRLFFAFAVWHFLTLSSGVDWQLASVCAPRVSQSCLKVTAAPRRSWSLGVDSRSFFQRLQSLKNIGPKFINIQPDTLFIKQNHIRSHARALNISTHTRAERGESKMGIFKKFGYGRWQSQRQFIGWRQCFNLILHTYILSIFLVDTRRLHFTSGYTLTHDE